MAPERQLEPTKPFEGAEVNRERLKSYQKALMAGDYDTARFLNLEGVSEEEQRKAREEVFSQKIGVMKIGWEAKHVIDQVRKLQAELGVSDEVAGERLHRFCVRGLKDPEYQRESLLKQLGQELPAQFGFSFGEDEIKGLREDGFVERIDREGLKELEASNLDAYLKSFGLDRSFVESPKIKAMIVRKIERELADADGRTMGEQWNESKYAHRTDLDKTHRFKVGYSALDGLLQYRDKPYFPTAELRAPEVQAQIDAWFTREMAALDAEDAGFKANLAKLHAGEKGDREEWESVEGHRRNLEEIFSINEELGASPELVRAPAVKAHLSDYLEEYLKGAESTISHLGIDRGQLAAAGFTEAELRQAAERGYLDCLEHRNFNKADDVIRRMALPAEFLESPSVVEAKIGVAKSLAEKKEFGSLAGHLSQPSLALPESVLRTEEMDQWKQRTVLDALDGAAPAHAIKTLVAQLDFSGCPEFFTGAELKEKLAARLQPAAQQFWADYCKSSYNALDFERQDDYLKAGYGNRDLKGTPQLFEAAQVAESLHNQPLVDWAITEEFTAAVGKLDQVEGYSLVYGQVGNREKLRKFFGTDPAVFREPTLEMLEAYAEEGPMPKEGDRRLPPFFTAKKIKEEFQKPFDLTDDEAHRLAARAFYYFAKCAGAADTSPYLKEWKISDYTHVAGELTDQFGLMPEETKEGAMVLYSAWDANTNGWGSAYRMDEMLKLKEKFRLKIDTKEIEDEKKQLAEGVILQSLDRGTRGMVFELAKDLEMFKVSKEFIERPDVRELASGCLKKALVSEGGSEQARVIAAKLLPGLTGEEVVALDPDVAAKLEVLRGRLPALAARCVSSVDAAISSFDLLKDQRDIVGLLKKHPFLGQAALANEQFSRKLLFKFASLDSLSKRNIETLYRCKDEVLAEHPGLKEGSPEFRGAMQEKLQSYRRNGEILQSMKNNGIDTDAWLNWREERRFNLGQEPDQAFSEEVATPIERIGATLENYKAAVYAALGTHREELRQAQAPAQDLEALKRKLEGLVAAKERAEATQDSAKAAGLARAISALEGQIAAVKTVPAWDKIANGIDFFERAKAAVLKTYDDIRSLEAALKQDATASAKIERAKRELKKNLEKLDERFAAFQKELQPFLAKALNADWAEALTQEIGEQAAEGLDHYRTDRSTLENAFAEKKEEAKPETIPVRIGIWGRNPDQDLYLGNYNDCCIRIDSEHMGAESTIADYLTDLGVQIIAIYDEKKGIPIAAAWCWPGVSNHDQTALVIDNIEANTNYSVDHRQQLEDELDQYVKEYANKIGLTHVVQGDSNNDLTIAQMDGSYYKIGGYNRPSGYYLEGEGHGGGEGEDEFEEVEDDDDDGGAPPEEAEGEAVAEA